MWQIVSSWSKTFIRNLLLMVKVKHIWGWARTVLAILHPVPNEGSWSARDLKFHTTPFIHVIQIWIQKYDYRVFKIICYEKNQMECVKKKFIFIFFFLKSIVWFFYYIFFEGSIYIFSWLFSLSFHYYPGFTIFLIFTHIFLCLM